MIRRGGIEAIHICAARNRVSRRVWGRVIRILSRIWGFDWGGRNRSPKREGEREGYDSVFDGFTDDVTIRLMPFSDSCIEATS